MKLRLGLPSKDIAHRFGISNTLCTHGLEVWQNISIIRFCIRYRKNTSNNAKKKVWTFGIIDYSEIFIESPKNLELQSATWSEYKHHNTLKFLVCVTPNSAITFCQE